MYLHWRCTTDNQHAHLRLGSKRALDPSKVAIDISAKALENAIVNNVRKGKFVEDSSHFASLSEDSPRFEDSASSFTQSKNACCMHHQTQKKEVRRLRKEKARERDEEGNY